MIGFVVFDWDSAKDAWLKETRGLSFQHVLFHIDRGDLLDVRMHPNVEKYPNQQILILRMGDYVYVVPFVREGDKLFLKTIIPSRKETRRYLK